MTSLHRVGAHVSSDRRRPVSRRRLLVIGLVVPACVAAVGITWIEAATPASAWSVSTFSPFDVPAGVGAGVPFAEYEAEGAHTTGTVTGPDYAQGTLASEASGRRFVGLSQGQYVEFTLTAPANAVDVAYNVARGAAGTLSIYVNGTKIDPKLQLNSKYSYVDTGWIGGSLTHHLFDDARVRLGTMVAAGGRVRLQVDAGDVAANIDVADFESVPAALSQPVGAISVTAAPYNADSSGRADATSAFNQAIATARSQGQPVWIPEGTFAINAPLQIDNVTMQGAGPWYSILHGTHLIDNTNSAGPIKLYDFAAIGEVTTRNDGSPDNFVNGSLGSGSVVSNIWIQHQKVGLWLMGSNRNLTIQNNRILDTTADGINFNGNVTNSVVKNNFIRNTGDDAIALWSLYSADANNSIENNTVVQPNLANGIALYGGTANSVSRNVVADTNALGSGIAVSNQQFISNGTFAPLSGTITIDDDYLIRAGAMNPNWHHPMSAIRFDAYDFAYLGVTVNYSGGKIIDSPYSAIEVVGGDGTGRAVTGLNVSGVTISNAGTVALQAETQGSATFTNVKATGLGVAAIYNCSYPPGTAQFAVNIGAGTSGMSSTVSGCAFPSPGQVGTEPTTSQTPPPTGSGGPSGTPPTSASPVSTPPVSPTPPADPGRVPPATNVALHKAVKGNWVQNYAPANAVDGDPGSYWESTNNAFPQSLTVDLGTSYRIDTVAMYLPPLSVWWRRTQTVSIEGSTDGSAFATIVGTAGYTFDPATGNSTSASFSATSARYVRLTFTANSGWSAAQLGELRVLTAGGSPVTAPTATPGDLELAAGRPTSASSYTDVYPSPNANDGNVYSYWESANHAYPQWLQVDLGASHTVQMVVMSLPPLAVWAARTQTLTIEGSVDGTNFTTLVASASYTFDPSTGNTATASLPATPVRYLRMTFTANTGWPAGQLSELRAYGH